MMRTLFVGVALFLVSTEVALANPPDPIQSSVDPILVGSAGGGEATRFTVVIRDVLGFPEPGEPVTIHFGTASGNPGMSASPHLHDSQISPVTVDCQGQVLSQLSGAGGVATFFARFGGAENDATVEVRGGGVLLRLIKIRSTDIDASGATGLNDFNLVRQNFLGNPAAQETDFDLDGVTGLGDFNLFRIDFLSGAVGTPCI